MVQSRAERLSICAPASAPLTESVADARSAPLPTSTADMVTAPPSGTWPLALGTIVRTMGGAATAEGEAWGLTAACALGDGAAAGEARGTTDGCARSASLGASVGGTPGGVGAWL